MNTDKTNTKKSKRLYFLDNARTFIIFLVIMLHAAAPYLIGDMLGWYWIVEDPSNNNVSSIIFLILDIFLMATLFFISGYMAPTSLEHKSGWEFLKGKFKRLMLPWAAAVFTLIPLYKAIFLYSRGLPQEHWTTYFHFINPNSQKWLWFLPVLFSFNLLYLLITKVNLRLPKLPVSAAVAISFMICVEYTYAIDMLGLNGWTSTPILDFQNERLLIYLIFFLLGAMFNRRGVFTIRPRKKTLFILVNAISWLPLMVYIFVMIWPLVINPGSYMISRLIDTSIKAVVFNLSLFLLVFTMIASFYYFGNKTKKILEGLSRNSFGVYIIHLIVTGLIMLLMRESGIPSFAKFIILTITTFLGSNLIISGSRVLISALNSLSKKKPAQTIESVKGINERKDQYIFRNMQSDTTTQFTVIQNTGGLEKS